MTYKLKFIVAIVCFMISTQLFSQIDEIKLDPDKVKKFSPYVEYKHGGAQGFETWKSTNKMQYFKEMWYYTESFYVKRDHLLEGFTLNEEIIDISRFEKNRKENEESIVILPGFKDALVLIPAKKLIYKP